MGWLDSLIDSVSGLFSGGGGEAAAQGAGTAADAGSAAGGFGIGDIANYAAGAIEPGTGMLQYISPESDYFTQLGGLGQQYAGNAPYYLSATGEGMPAASAGTSGTLGGAFNSAQEGLGKAGEWMGKNPGLTKLGLGAGLTGAQALMNRANQPKMPSFNMPTPNAGPVAPLTPDYTPPPGTMASPLLRQQPQVKDNSGLSKKSGGMAAF